MIAGAVKCKKRIGSTSFIITNTDWQDEIFQTALTTNNNISVSGALFDKLPVRLSVGNVENWDL
jgi:hypothetical protein